MPKKIFANRPANDLIRWQWSRTMATYFFDFVGMCQKLFIHVQQFRQIADLFAFTIAFLTSPTSWGASSVQHVPLQDTRDSLIGEYDFCISFHLDSIQGVRC
jgi:hypothetical protein